MHRRWLAVGSWWFLMKVQPRVKDRVFDRTSALVLSQEAAFDLWWAKGVLSLYAKLPDGTERAATRRDDWRAWVRELPDLTPPDLTPPVLEPEIP